MNSLHEQFRRESCLHEQSRRESSILVFVHGTVIPSLEDNIIEYKDKRRIELKELSIIVSGFMNTNGGKVFYGISDIGVINGIKKTRKEIDEFHLRIDDLHSMINYPGKTGRPDVRVTFHPIYSQHGKIMTDTYIICIDVPKKTINEDVCAHDGFAYIRCQASFRKKDVLPQFVPLFEHQREMVNAVQREVELGKMLKKIKEENEKWIQEIHEQILCSDRFRILICDQSRH
jgi:hypothetical protein